jgi:hypothetical protein
MDLQPYNFNKTWKSFSEDEIKQMILEKAPHLKMNICNVLLQTRHEVDFNHMFTYLWKTLLADRKLIDDYPFIGFMDFLCIIPRPEYFIISWKYSPVKVHKLTNDIFGKLLWKY